ncbi:MAG: thioredoxin family protein [Planctomycetaceae bacterium]
MERVPPNPQPRLVCSNYSRLSRALTFCTLSGLVLLCTGCDTSTGNEEWESARYRGLMTLAVILNSETPPENEQTQPEINGHRKQVLYFTASWCGPCERWHQQELPRLRAQGWNEDWLTLIDVDQQPDLRTQYNVHIVPTFILLQGNLEQSRRTGFIDAVSFAAWVNAL